MMKTLVLASASPRRSELLNQIGVEFRQQVIEIAVDKLVGRVPTD